MSEKDCAMLPLKRTLRLLCCPLVVVVLCLPGTSACQELGPPLPTWFPITSTFGEYRTQHFHGGIDLATGGRIGVPVLAVAGGYVQRVRVSGAGYGKALDLAMDNGMTAVYGHLDRFSAAIESLALSEQLESGQYEEELVLEPGCARVARGDTIGFSGDTGASSGPHLHFELKRSQTILNPLTVAYDLADGIRPAFNYVRLVPVGPESEIDGANAPRVVRLGSRRGGVREAASVPRVAGSFYVCASVFDRVEGASSRLAVYDVRLFLDDSLVFENRFDAVEEPRTNEVELAYDLELAKRGEHFALNLRRFDGEQLPALRGFGPRAGVIDLENRALRGPHVLRVEAADAAGNTSTAVVKFVAGSRPSVETVSLAKDGAALSVRALVRNGGASGIARRVWLKHDLRGVEGDPERTPLHAAAQANGGPGADADYACEVRLPASLERASLEDMAGEVKVYVDGEDGFPGAQYTARLPGAPEPRDVTADLTVTRHRDFAEIRVGVSPGYLRPRIGVVARDTVWLRVREDKDGQYSARFRFSHLFSSGGTVVCVIPAGKSRVVTRSSPIALGLCRKDTSGVVRSPDGGAAFRYEPDTFYGDTYLSISKKERGDLPAGLTFASDVFSLEPGDVVFDKRGTVVIRCADGAAASGKVAVYGRDSGSRWTYAGSVPDTLANTIEARVRTLRDYALIRDDVPPNVSGVLPRSGRVVAGGTPVIRARVRDAGSGVEWKGMTVSVDGRKVLSVWDPRYSTLSVVHTSPLAPGKHRAVFEVKDRSGNLRVAETSFRVAR